MCIMHRKPSQIEIENTSIFNMPQHLVDKIISITPPESYSWILLAILVIIFTTIKRMSTTSSASTTAANKHLPPSPWKLPIIGNLHQLGMYPHRSLHSLSKRHGPLMLLHFGSTPVLVISSADYAREIMKTHDLVFASRPKATTFEKLLYKKNDVSMAPYGEYWRQIRSICVLQLLSNKRVRSFRSVRHEELDIFIKKIEKSSLVNLSDAFASLTNDIICRVALGRKYDGKKFINLLKEFTRLLNVFDVGDYIPSLGWVNKINGVDGMVERVAKEFDEFLEEVVEEHASKLLDENKRDNDDNKDFVDVLLEIQKDGSAGFPLSRVSIKAITLDMFAAGIDTTYTVLEWAMTQLLRHSKVMEELQDEVRRIGNGKPTIQEEDLEKMHYLKAIIKETLRLHPPIPLLVPHCSTRDVQINGYDIAAGTTAITNAWAIGRDPSSWDEPDEFKPKRFLSSARDFKGHDFELIPFGAGRRSCPGTLFAIAINELVLANLVYKFDWALSKGTKVEDLDMSECTGLTIHRKIPLFAVATPHFV